MLIATNSQREKTAWDKLEEVRRTRILLEKIRKQEKISGGTRELVASALSTSPAQIGRYDAILKNLCPEFMEEVKRNRINISTAYELSGLTADEQKAAFEEYRDSGRVSIKSARERKQEPTKAKTDQTPTPPNILPFAAQPERRISKPVPAMNLNGAMERLEELWVYCDDMKTSGNSFRDWQKDAQALLFVMERLKQEMT